MSLKFSNICNKIISSVKLNEDNNGFVSLKDTNKEPESSKLISPRIEDKKELSDSDLQKRNELVNKAKESIENTLDDNKELKDILNEIKDLTKEYEINKWVVNEEKNTARLGTKDAQLFLQNNNICLSYKDKIHIFKSVKELHNWLHKHDFPLPENICLHESILQEQDDNNIDQDKTEELKKLFGNDFFEWLRNNYPNDPKYQPFFKDVQTEECCTTSGGLGGAISWLGNKKLKEDERKKSYPAFKNTWWEQGVKIFYTDSERCRQLIRALTGKDGRPIKSTSIMNPSLEDIKYALNQYIKSNSGDLKTINDIENLIKEINKNPSNKKEIIASRLNDISTKDRSAEPAINLLDKYFNGSEEYNELYNIIENPTYMRPVVNSFIAAWYSYMDKEDDVAHAEIQNIFNKNIQSKGKREQFNRLCKTFSKVAQDTAFYSDFIRPLFKNLQSPFQILSKESFKEELKKTFNMKDQTLTEDETPADFATGASGGTDAGNLDMNIDTSIDTSNVGTGDINTDMDTTSGPTTPASFGDININAPAGNGDYAPEDPNAIQAPIKPEEEFIIDDVKINNDTGEVRIVVKNKKTGKTELKTLSEIDV